MHIVKKKGYIYCTIKHLVPTTTNLQTNRVRIQDEPTTYIHFGFYHVQIWTSVQQNEALNLYYEGTLQCRHRASVKCMDGWL